MMHTRFAYTPSNTMPLSPRAAGRFEIRDPPPPSLFTHTARYSTIPRGIPSPGATALDRRTRRRPVIDSTATPRPRTRANARTAERGDATARTKTLDRRAFAFRIGICTRHVDAPGVMVPLPVVLLPRGWHAEAEAEDVGDRFVVHAGARTRTRARARGEVVLFPDARIGR